MRIEVLKTKTKNGATRWFVQLIERGRVKHTSAYSYRRRNRALKDANLIARFLGVEHIRVEPK